MGKGYLMPVLLSRPLFRSRDQDRGLGLQVSRPRPWPSGLETETETWTKWTRVHSRPWSRDHNTA